MSSYKPTHLSGVDMFSLSAQIFTFGMAAKGAGITEKQLRNWLARSLIDLPAEDDRTESNWRRFAFTDVLHIATVARLSRYGVGIPEADRIYQEIVGSRLRGFRRFKNAPQDAMVRMLMPIEIGICQSLGGDNLRYWQRVPGEVVDFSAPDAPPDYAVVSMGALLEGVTQRLLATVDQEGKPNG